MAHRIRQLQRYLALRPFTEKSLVLVLLGFIFVIIGANTFAQPWSDRAREHLFMLLAIGPQEFWGVLTACCGLLAVWSSRWPTMNDTWGFVALAVISMWFACAFAVGLTQRTTAVAGLLQWLTICLLLWSISRLVDPGDREAERELVRDLNRRLGLQDE